MSCSSPLIRIDSSKYPGLERKDVNGGYIYPLDSYNDLVNRVSKEDIVFIPCGQCRGCRLNYSLQWAARLELESRSWKYGYFLTLTFSDEFIDKSYYYDLYKHDFYQGSLNVRDMQLFFKSFRRKIEPFKCKVFYCGEYGDQFQRPHYHAIVLTDYKLDLKFMYFRDGHNYYTCRLCDDAWMNKGYIVISDFSFEDAAYVARYCLKKVNLLDHVKHEVIVSLGDVNFRTPPFSHMSLRPAIAREYVDKNYLTIYNDDLIYTRKSNSVQALSPPRYFDKRLEELDPILYDSIKERRDLQSLLFSNSSEDIISKIKKRGIINDSRHKFSKRII